MTVLDDLQGVTDQKERSRIKARAFAQLGALQGESITRGNFRLTLVDGPYMDGHTLGFSIQVNRVDNGNDVTPPNLNPIRVVNPPLLVPDVNGPIDLGARGKHRLDVRGCLLEIIRVLK